MKTKRMSQMIAMLVVGLAVLVGCGGNKSKDTDVVKQIQERGKLVVATSADYPPFEFQVLENGKNQIVGSDIDLAQKIADKLGVKLEMQSMDFDTVLVAVSEGKVDFAISAISATEERKKAFDFSNNYYTPGNKLIVKKSDLDKYTTTESLKGLKIGAQKGSIQEEVVTSQLPETQEISIASIPNLINEVKTGKIAGMVIEEAIGTAYIQKNPDLAFAEIPLKSNADDSYSIALQKGKGALLTEINQVIDGLKKNNEIEAMVTKNFELAEKGE